MQFVFGLSITRYKGLVVGGLLFLKEVIKINIQVVLELAKKIIIMLSSLFSL